MASAEGVREVETASMNDIIDLNVGGTKFQTTRYLHMNINKNLDPLITLTICSILLCQADIIARSQFDAGENV